MLAVTHERRPQAQGFSPRWEVAVRARWVAAAQRRLLSGLGSEEETLAYDDAGAAAAMAQ